MSIENTQDSKQPAIPPLSASACSASWLPITIFLVALFGGVIVIGLYVVYRMPCPLDWTGEWHQKWVSIQVRTFCLWSTAWALIVLAVSKICAPRE